ncbi:tetratricopeptide repeat-containing sulfotransferase family protein [Pseudoxanthomonas beigongshangi]
MNASIFELSRRAEQLAGQRNWDGAQALYEEILARQPGHPGALVQLSYIASLQGRYRSAHDYALKAAGARPKDLSVLAELAKRLRTFNEAEVLLDCLRNLGSVDRIPIPVLLAFAAQLSYLNRQEDALRLLDEAKRADPDYPPTLMARSQILTYLGRFQAAEQDLQYCLRRAPEIAQAWWLVSRLRKQSREANHVDRLRRLLATPGKRPEEVALLAYALHKELDDIGDIAGAGEALTLAGRAKRSTLKYQSEESRRLVDALIELPPPAGLAPSAVARDSIRIPVFIVGMHRSGTTLLEQLLDGHGDIHGVGELYDFTSQMRWATDYHCRGVIDETLVRKAAAGVDYAAAGRGYLQKMEWRLGKERFFTDKLPSNFLNIGFICQALPQARILHMVRDPVETCFSNLRELFSDANPYSYDQQELAFYYRQYERLMAHWRAVYPGRVLDVDYGRLTRDTEAVLREVADFCGFDFEPGMLALQERTRGVATASAVQVRDRVVALERPKWAPYENYLQPLIRGLKAETA